VHFYTSEASLVERVGGYLLEGLAEGEVAIVVATKRHRHALDAHLRGAGVDVAEARSSGRYVSLDAGSLLERLMPAGRLDVQAFHALAGGLVRRAVATGLPVRAYGEMVALLWESGAVLSAIELEELWNELQREQRFGLLCGYAAASVSAGDHAEALGRMCELHSSVIRSEGAMEPAEPPLEIVTANEVTRRFVSSTDAARSARRFAVEVLQEWGYEGGIVSDAALVLTELVANAVLHSSSASFSVSLRDQAAGFRVAVSDADTARPVTRAFEAEASSGRGMGLVTAFAGTWGCEVQSDGKVVWAEFAAG
jgi:anti-sigma regulatory factor (Ser/Thr protein kinase)